MIIGPLSQANKITMVSDGTGEIGASRITAEVLAIMQTIPGIVTSMTGVDFLKKAGGTTQWINIQKSCLYDNDD